VVLNGLVIEDGGFGENGWIWPESHGRAVVGAGASLFKVLKKRLAIFVLFARDLEKVAAINKLNVENATITMDGNINLGA